jgi:hypothetical protein
VKDMISQGGKIAEAVWPKGACLRLTLSGHVRNRRCGLKAAMDMLGYFAGLPRPRCACDRRRES